MRRIFGGGGKKEKAGEGDTRANPLAAAGMAGSIPDEATINKQMEALMVRRLAGGGLRVLVACIPALAPRVLVITPASTTHSGTLARALW